MGAGRRGGTFNVQRSTSNVQLEAIVGSWALKVESWAFGGGERDLMQVERAATFNVQRSTSNVQPEATGGRDECEV